MNNRIFFRIHGGTVQGVNFRRHTQKKALEWGLTGWIRNVAGEKIEGEAQGDSESLQKLIKDIRTGPKHAHVVKVETAEIPVVEGETEFGVKR